MDLLEELSLQPVNPSPASFLLPIAAEPLHNAIDHRWFHSGEINVPPKYPSQIETRDICNIKASDWGLMNKRKFNLGLYFKISWCAMGRLRALWCTVCSLNEVVQFT